MKPNYAAYWAALLKQHRACIAAGCISPIGHAAPKKKRPTEETPVEVEEHDQ